MTIKASVNEADKMFLVVLFDAHKITKFIVKKLYTKCYKKQSGTIKKESSFLKQKKEYKSKNLDEDETGRRKWKRWWSISYK